MNMNLFKLLATTIALQAQGSKPAVPVLRLPPAVKVTVPPQREIVGPTILLSAIAEVPEFATQTVNAARKNVADGSLIEALPIPYKWVVPPGKREMQAGPIRGALDGSLVTVPVTVMVDGKPAKTVEVSFKIKRMTP